MNAKKTKPPYTVEDFEPDYDYWARLETWQQEEVICLLKGLQPPVRMLQNNWLLQQEFKSELEKIQYPGGLDEQSRQYYKEFMKRLINEFKKLEPSFNYEPKVEDDLYDSWDLVVHLNEVYDRALQATFSREEMKRFGDIEELFFRGFKELFPEKDFRPSDVVKWAISKNLEIPEPLIEKVKKYHPDKFNEEVLVEAELVEAEKGYHGKEFPNPIESEKISQGPLCPEERRELGMLREEKKKWDKAIEATVEAVLMAGGKEIKRDELIKKLHHFNLPFTTVEVIWKALREKDLTKKAGRPSSKNR